MQLQQRFSDYSIRDASRAQILNGFIQTGCVTQKRHSMFNAIGVQLLLLGYCSPRTHCIT
jgi:hypothetical protein